MNNNRQVRIHLEDLEVGLEVLEDLMGSKMLSDRVEVVVVLHLETFLKNLKSFSVVVGKEPEDSRLLKEAKTLF